MEDYRELSQAEIDARLAEFRRRDESEAAATTPSGPGELPQPTGPQRSLLRIVTAELADCLDRIDNAVRQVHRLETEITETNALLKQVQRELGAMAEHGR